MSLIGPRRKSLNDCFQAMGITGSANLERPKSTRLGRRRCRPRMTPSGQEERLPPSRLGGCCLLGQETFAGTHGSGREAPRAVVRPIWDDLTLASPAVCTWRTASTSNSFVNRRWCIIEFLCTHTGTLHFSEASPEWYGEGMVRVYGGAINAHSTAPATYNPLHLRQKRRPPCCLALVIKPRRRQRQLLHPPAIRANPPVIA